jgi:hypothetical protein
MFLDTERATGSKMEGQNPFSNAPPFYKNHRPDENEDGVCWRIRGAEEIEKYAKSRWEQ